MLVEFISEKKYRDVDYDTATNKDIQPKREDYLTPISTQDRTGIPAEARPRRANAGRYQMTRVEQEVHEYDPLHEGQLEDSSPGETGIASQERHSYEEPKSRYDEIPDYQRLKEERERKQHPYTHIQGATTSQHPYTHIQGATTSHPYTEIQGATTSQQNYSQIQGVIASHPYTEIQGVTTTQM
jgi:hypothetical protein